MISVLGRCDVYEYRVHPNLSRPVRHTEENIDSDYEYFSEDEPDGGEEEAEENYWEDLGEAVYIPSDDE